MGEEVTRIYIALAIAAALGGILWHDHHVTKMLKASRVETAQANATIEQLRKSREIEQADRKRNDETEIAHLAELERLRAEPPITGVYCRTSRPKLPAQSGTAAVTNDPTTGRQQSETESDPGRDVSEGLDEYATNCAVTAKTLVDLQAWEVARTH